MISRLYLLRHGIAIPHGTPDVADDDRPLTPKGESHVREIAAGLREIGVEPGVIISSPLPRARQTAEIVFEVLGLENRLQNDDILRPGSNAASIHDWLRTRDDDCLMLVGHNPNLTALIGLLIGFPDPNLPFELKKGGLAELRHDQDNPFRLQWLATPKLLRRIHRH